MKFIRLDDVHFAYLVDTMFDVTTAREMSERFTEAWPGKRLIIIAADEFIDLTGQYEVIPVSAPVPA